MNFLLELSAKLLFPRGLRSLGLTGWISLVGLVLGVACLVVSMAVVTGFKFTLQRSVSDLTGHLQILKTQGLLAEGMPKLIEEIKSHEKKYLASTPVLWVEGVATVQGKVSGVLLQGLDPQVSEDVVKISQRLIAGKFDFSLSQGSPQVLVGKGLAEKFHLVPGDLLRVVVPLPGDSDAQRFRRKAGTFRVAGILDLGKYEFNERFVVAAMKDAQELADVGPRYSGVLVRLQDHEGAIESSRILARSLGFGYRVKDWHEMNENIFDAIEIEKIVIFFVILVIILAAAFNVSSSLWVAVYQRYPEIGILKALGMKPIDVVKVFSMQGLLLGLIGCVVGFLLGGVLCLAFSWGQSLFGLLPGSVYKLDHIDVAIQFWDVFFIFLATMLICGLATLVPARRGARLTSVEGLRYE